MLKKLVLAASLLALPALAQGTETAQPAPMAHGPVTPEVQAARQAVRQACAGDIATFCKDIQPGGGKVAMCLKDHKADISAACKTAWQNLHAARKAATQ